MEKEKNRHLIFHLQTLRPMQVERTVLFISQALYCFGSGEKKPPFKYKHKIITYELLPERYTQAYRQIHLHFNKVQPYDKNSVTSIQRVEGVCVCV